MSQWKYKVVLPPSTVACYGTREELLEIAAVCRTSFAGLNAGDKGSLDLCEKALRENTTPGAKVYSGSGKFIRELYNKLADEVEGRLHRDSQR